jgi:hypothetical protein
MIRIRVKHLYDFTRALASERYRRSYVLECYSEKHSKDVSNLLKNTSDPSEIMLVLGPDDICRSCPLHEEMGDNCEFPDSAWNAKEFMYKVSPNEVVTAAYLKRQLRLYQNVRRRDDWKKIIIQSRTAGQ